jgi:hypothetical protein
MKAVCPANSGTVIVPASGLPGHAVPVYILAQKKPVRIYNLQTGFCAWNDNSQADVTVKFDFISRIFFKNVVPSLFAVGR